jgi:predicted enzyme related to lactoylglutathione lyase
MLSSHGRFIWYVLLTTDREAAKAFYTGVVGWGTRDASMPSLPYTVFTVGETLVSGCMDLSEAARRKGERPRWIGYVAVDDVDATADRFKHLGGAVHVPPQDILNMSRVSFVADPQTATLALVKWLNAGHEQPSELRGPGRVGWHELLAADAEKAWAFYSELFGWQKAEADNDLIGAYQLFAAGGQTIGGMYAKPPMVPAPFWLYYFNVGDIDAAAKRVEAASGQILWGPIEVPGGNWIVHCSDPQGAVFALLGNNGIGYFERVTSRQEAQRIR